MIPLQIVAIGIIALGTVLLGVDHKRKSRDPNKKHGNRRNPGDTAGKQPASGESVHGARRVGPKLEGTGNARVVNTALVMDGGNGAGDDNRGKPDPASGPDPKPSVNGEQKTKSGGAAQHQESASGKPSSGKGKTKKKKGAVEDAKS